MGSFLPNFHVTAIEASMAFKGSPAISCTGLHKEKVQPFLSEERIS